MPNHEIWGIDWKIQDSQAWSGGTVNGSSLPVRRPVFLCLQTYNNLTQGSCLVRRCPFSSRHTPTILCRLFTRVVAQYASKYKVSPRIKQFIYQEKCKILLIYIDWSEKYLRKCILRGLDQEDELEH